MRHSIQLSHVTLAVFLTLCFQNQGICNSRSGCSSEDIRNAYAPLPPLRNHDRASCQGLPIPSGYPDLPRPNDQNQSNLPPRGSFGLNHFYPLTAQSTCDPSKASEISRIIRGGPPLNADAVEFLRARNVSDVFDLRGGGELTLEAAAATRRALSAKCDDIKTRCMIGADFACTRAALARLSGSQKSCVNRIIAPSLNRRNLGSPAGRNSPEYNWVVDQGMTYHHEIVRPKNRQQTWPDRISEIVDKIHRTLMQNNGRNVYIHCAAGADRTGTIIAAYQAKYGGCTGSENCKRIACERNRFHFSEGYCFLTRGLMSICGLNSPLPEANDSTISTPAPTSQQGQTAIGSDQ